MQRPSGRSYIEIWGIVDYSVELRVFGFLTEGKRECDSLLSFHQSHYGFGKDLTRKFYLRFVLFYRKKINSPLGLEKPQY